MLYKDFFIFVGLKLYSMKKIILLTFLFVAVFVRAAKVDTISVRSNAMGKDVKVIVVVPDVKNSSPVVYLLHGYGGNEASWLVVRPDLPQIADREGIIFVCPDGQKSWYWDSPKVSTSRYETFISKELIEYIDQYYRTIPSRNARAITGLSMGGHGAMWNALRHPDVFGAAGSTSGGVDIRPFPNNWDIKVSLGEEFDNREIWENYTVINQVDKIKNGELALIIDCGYDDFFFEINNDFHKKLLKYKIGHDFIVRPGGHTQEYWKNSILYQILFFKNYFDSKQ